jgi:hypothetical protein
VRVRVRDVTTYRNDKLKALSTYWNDKLRALWRSTCNFQGAPHLCALIATQASRKSRDHLAPMGLLDMRPWRSAEAFLLSFPRIKNMALSVSGSTHLSQFQSLRLSAKKW